MQLMTALRPKRTSVLDAANVRFESEACPLSDDLGHSVGAAHGRVEGHYTDWTPLESRLKGFGVESDESDPWQFRNVLAARAM